MVVLSQIPITARSSNPDELINIDDFPTFFPARNRLDSHSHVHNAPIFRIFPRNAQKGPAQDNMSLNHSDENEACSIQHLIRSHLRLVELETWPAAR